MKSLWHRLLGSRSMRFSSQQYWLFCGRHPVTRPRAIVTSQISGRCWKRETLGRENTNQSTIDGLAHCYLKLTVSLTCCQARQKMHMVHFEGNGFSDCSAFLVMEETHRGKENCACHQSLGEKESNGSQQHGVPGFLRKGNNHRCLNRA